MALVNTCCQQTVQTLANEGGIIGAVKQEAWRSTCAIAQQMELSTPKVLKILPDVQLDPYHDLGNAQLLPEDCLAFLLNALILTSCAISQ
jgi:hypothetical protein